MTREQGLFGGSRQAGVAVLTAPNSKVAGITMSSHLRPLLITTIITRSAGSRSIVMHGKQMTLSRCWQH